LDFVEQVPGKVLLGCVTAFCKAAWVTSEDQIDYYEGHGMTGREISFTNIDIHESEEKLCAKESKEVEKGVKAIKMTMQKLMRTDGIFGPSIVSS